MPRAAFVTALLLGIGLVGCFIVTGGTSDYTSEAEGGSEAGIGCPPDGAACVRVACASTADCRLDGGASFCCLSLIPSPPGAAFACQAKACTGGLAAQVCATADECGDGGLCKAQTCAALGVSVVFRTCEAFPCR